MFERINMHKINTLDYAFETDFKQNPRLLTKLDIKRVISILSSILTNVFKITPQFSDDPIDYLFVPIINPSSCKINLDLADYNFDTSFYFNIIDDMYFLYRVEITLLDFIYCNIDEESKQRLLNSLPIKNNMPMAINCSISSDINYSILSTSFNYFTAVSVKNTPYPVTLFDFTYTLDNIRNLCLTLKVSQNVTNQIMPSVQKVYSDIKDIEKEKIGLFYKLLCAKNKNTPIEMVYHDFNHDNMTDLKTVQLLFNDFMNKDIDILRHNNEIISMLAI